MTVYNMKKTFYYKFFPAKTEEMAETSIIGPYKATRILVEVRDDHYSFTRDPGNPWVIRKTVTNTEILTGRLGLTYYEMFEHVFRFWAMDMVQHVIAGGKCYVTVIDYTDNAHKKVQGECVYVKGGPNDTYSLTLMDVVHGRPLVAGDQVGLFWDPKMQTFAFKVLSNGNN